MKKKTYLEKPCQRCNKHTLLPWEEHGQRLLSQCDTCGKYMGVSIVDHDDGSQAYTLYIFGGKAREEKRIRSHRLPIRHLNKDTETVITALDYWDEHRNTVQYNT